MDKMSMRPEIGERRYPEKQVIENYFKKTQSYSSEGDSFECLLVRHDVYSESIKCRQESFLEAQDILTYITVEIREKSNVHLVCHFRRGQIYLLVYSQNRLQCLNT